MRRGFTLMEMVLVLAIISIVGGVGILSVKFYKTNKNKIDADYYLNATVSFINNSKMYCRENSCKAIIAFDMERNEMKFYSNFTIINKLTFSDKITLREVVGRMSNYEIAINKDGFTNDACTIILIDNNSIEHKITMRVGTEYVKIIK